MKKFFKLVVILLPLLYAALIFFLSSHPSDAFVDTGLFFDDFLKEALHLIEFAILYSFLVLAFLTKGPLTKRASFNLALLAVAYGLSDEFHQYFVPSRSATLIDFMKDTIGVMVVWYLVNRFYFQNPESKISRFMLKFQRYWQSSSDRHAEGKRRGV